MALGEVSHSIVESGMLDENSAEGEDIATGELIESGRSWSVVLRELTAERRLFREARDFGECAEEEAILELDLIESSVDQEVMVLVVELVATGVVGEGVGEVVAERLVVEIEAGVFRLVNTAAVVIVVVVKAAAAAAEEDREGEGEEGDVEEAVGVLVVGVAMILGVLTPAARAARR